MHAIAKLFFLMVLVHHGLLFPLQQESKKKQEPLIRNLIMIMDQSTDEVGALFAPLYFGICQQASPILITQRAFHNFIWHIIMEKKEVTIPWQEWDFYYGAKGFILLVPREYSSALKKEFIDKSEEELIGLAINDTKKMNKLKLESSSNVAKQKEHMAGWQTDIQLVQFKMAETPNKNRDSGVDTDALSNLFLSTQEGIWNIYLVGHGTYPVSQDQLSNFFTHRKYTQEINIEKFRIRIAGFSVENFKKLIYLFNRINTNFVYVASCFSGGYNRMLPYVTNLYTTGIADNGRFTGEKISQIKSDIRVENNRIVKVRPNFTLAIGSSTDSSTGTGFPSYYLEIACSKNPKKIPENVPNFLTFFGRLAYVIRQAFQKNFFYKPSLLKDLELRTILTSVTVTSVDTKGDKVDPLSLYNSPWIMFPKTNYFIFFPLEPERVTVLNATKVYGSILEENLHLKKNLITSSLSQSPMITLPFLGKKMPEVVALPIANIEPIISIEGARVPYFFSLLPGIGLHTFNTLYTPNVSLEQLLTSFSLRSEDIPFPKFFFIKNLIIKNERAEQEEPVKLLNNVVIVSGSLLTHGIGMDIYNNVFYAVLENKLDLLSNTKKSPHVFINKLGVLPSEVDKESDILTLIPFVKSSSFMQQHGDLKKNFDGATAPLEALIKDKEQTRGLELNNLKK